MKIEIEVLEKSRMESSSEKSLSEVVDKLVKKKDRKHIYCVCSHNHMFPLFTAMGVLIGKV